MTIVTQTAGTDRLYGRVWCDVCSRHHEPRTAQCGITTTFEWTMQEAQTMTTIEPTELSLPDRLVRLTKSCPCISNGRCAGIPHSPGLSQCSCSDCGGTGRVYILGDAVRKRCTDKYEGMPFGESMLLPIGSLCPTCDGRGWTPSTRSMDWWRAFWTLADQRSMVIGQFFDGMMWCVPPFGRLVVGRTDVEMLTQAIAELPVVQQAMREATA